MHVFVHVHVLAPAATLKTIECLSESAGACVMCRYSMAQKKLMFCLRCTERNIPFHLRFVSVLIPFCGNEMLNFGAFVPSK